MAFPLAYERELAIGMTPEIGGERFELPKPYGTGSEPAVVDQT